MPTEYNVTLRAGQAQEVTVEGRPATPSGPFLLLEEFEGLDGLAARTTEEDLPDADGVYLGDVTRGPRTLVATGLIFGRSRTEVRSLDDRLRAATNPTTATWPLRISGYAGRPDVEVSVRTAAAGPYRSKDTNQDGNLKAFQVALVAPEPRLLGTAEHAAIVYPPEAAGGFSFPLAFPLSFGGLTAIGTDIVVAGTDTTWPLLRLHGRLVNPVLVNQGSGERFHLLTTIGAGEVVVIDPHPLRRTVIDNAGRDLYAAIARPASVWWPLYPGVVNPVLVTSDEHDDNARLELSWRDAYL